MSKTKSQVLIVDDEPLVLSSLKNLLELDFIVHTAESGKKALEILATNPIKVIMSDQRMPEMMGHEILREAKRISPNTIRILLTGYSDLESIIQSVNAGEIFRYINKPWKAETILSVFKLGAQIYDRLAMFSPPKEPVTKPTNAENKVLIEVEEKSHAVLFVGYNDKEAENLVKQVQSKYQAYQAGSIDEALQKIAQKPVSVIISNVEFDKYNAIDFLNTVKSEYPDVVTVILTEVADAELAIRSINELNVYRYLVKPVSDVQLKEVIDRAVEKNLSFKVKPETNLIQTARQLSPNSVPTDKLTESALRLKLRAAQQALEKLKTRQSS